MLQPKQTPRTYQLDYQGQLPSRGVQHYRSEGWVIVQDHLPLEWVNFTKHHLGKLENHAQHVASQAGGKEGRLVQDGAEWVFGGKWPDSRQIVKRVAWCGGYDPALLVAGRDQRILGVARQLLSTSKSGPVNSIDHLINQVHFKNPGDGVKFEWHQDIRSRNNRKSGKEVAWNDTNGEGSYVAIMTAIDYMSADNGPIKIVSNSKLPRDVRNVDLRLDRSAAAIGGRSFEELAFNVYLAPGDSIIFHPYVIHASEPNLSRYARRVLINGFAIAGANNRAYVGKGAAPSPEARIDVSAIQSH